MDNDLLARITELEKNLFELNQEMYTNNWSASQDFNKYSRFNTRLKVPKYSSDPAIGEVGEIIEVGGKLKICSSTNVWTIVGVQV